MNKYLVITVYALVLMILLLGYVMIKERSEATRPSVERLVGALDGEKGLEGFNGEFQIDFPDKPSYRHKQELLDNGQGYVHRHIYSYEAPGGSSYLVLVREYPDDYSIPKPQERLEGDLRKILKAQEVESPKSKEPGSWNGYPSLRFVIETSAGSTHGLLIVVKNRLYRILLIQPPGRPVDPAPFFDSFHTVALP